VDGNISVENAAILAGLGARVFVLGTSSVFRENTSGEALGDAFREFKSAVAAKRKVV
jgi:pentose-5-phosphate-3-epimerase